MRKKAQIATALMVIVAIGLSAAALFAMLSFKSDFVFKSAEMEKITYQINFLNDYILEQSKVFAKETITACAECSPEQIAAKAKQFDANHKARSDSEGNFFAKLRNNEFTLTKNNNIYTLNVKDVFVQTQSSYNTLKRNFDICQEFNSQGDFIKDCPLKN